MVSLVPKDKEVGLDNSDEDEDDVYVEDTEPSPPRMKNLTEVIDCLEDIRSFLSRTVMQKKQLGLMSY